MRRCDDLPSCMFRVLQTLTSRAAGSCRSPLHPHSRAAAFCAAAPAPAVLGDSALGAGSPAAALPAATDAQGPAFGPIAAPMQSAAGAPFAPAGSPDGMPMPQPTAMLGPDIMALVDDVIPPSADGTAAQVPDTAPSTPVDSLKSDSDSPPAEPETSDAEAGSDTSGGDVLPAEAPDGGDAHADGELTAYQALLSGAYLRDLVSMQPKEHSTFAWVSTLIAVPTVSCICVSQRGGSMFYPRRPHTIVYSAPDGHTCMQARLGRELRVAISSRVQCSSMQRHGSCCACEVGHLSLQVHGILMASAWGLVIPCGVLLSRYGKAWTHWFAAHRAVQARVRRCGATRTHVPGPDVDV